MCLPLGGGPADVHATRRGLGRRETANPLKELGRTRVGKCRSVEFFAPKFESSPIVCPSFGDFRILNDHLRLPANLARGVPVTLPTDTRNLLFPSKVILMLAAFPVACSIIFSEPVRPQNSKIATRNESATIVAEYVLGDDGYAAQLVQQSQNRLPRRLAMRIGRKDRSTQHTDSTAARYDRTLKLDNRRGTHVQRTIDEHGQVKKTQVLGTFDDGPTGSRHMKSVEFCPVGRFELTPTLVDTLAH